MFLYDNISNITMTTDMQGLVLAITEGLQTTVRIYF